MGISSLLHFVFYQPTIIQHMLDRFLIVTQGLGSPHRRRGTLLAAGLLVMFLGTITAFGTAPDTKTFYGQFNNVVEQLGAPAPDIGDSSPSPLVSREIRIRTGDSVSSLLSRMGVEDIEARAFLSSNREAAALFRQLVPGKALTAKIGIDGSLHNLVFPLNGGKANLRIARTPEGFSVATEEMIYDRAVMFQSATIRHSLFGAADDAGIPESVATRLADIFGGDIDFHRDLRKGDRFSVVYESASHLGKQVRADRILAAEFINDNRTYRAFWYQDKNGADGGGYYTEDGRSMKKAFLRSPIEFSRISSGFSSARYHPVLQETRAHRGIDYAAPIGTRVRVTGDGTIHSVGTQGGYGKIVTIRHSGDRVTAYGHLSGFAPGIKQGMRVAQGDVIGYVGATGLATGPHLHYEFRVAGVHRNPLTVPLPTAAPLSQASIGAFRTHAGELIGQLETAGRVQLVMLD